MTRPLKIALALSLTSVTLVWWMLLRFTRGGNFVAVVGALVPGLAIFIVAGWYELVIAKRSYQEDMDQMMEAAELRDRIFRWPVLVMTLALPGLWIGATARAPLAVAAGYWLVTGLAGWVNHVTPPSFPEREVTRRRGEAFGLLPEQLAPSLALVLGGALVGIMLRRCLQW